MVATISVEVDALSVDVEGASMRSTAVDDASF